MLIRTPLVFLLLNLLLFSAILSSCQTTSSQADNEAEPVETQAAEAEFVPIFNGETLDGWEGDSTYWRVENGNLVGEITPETTLENNSFIIWQGGRPGDFELKT